MMTVRWTLAGVAIVFGTVFAAAQQGARGGEWMRYGADSGATRYAPLDQINKDNVAQLRVAWRRQAVDASISSKVPDFSYSSNFRATPLMIGGVLYSPNGIGLVEAFHPGTGKTLWVQQPFPDEPEQGLRGDSARGVASWADGARTASVRDPRRIPDRTRPAHRRAADGLRRQGPGQPATRSRPSRDAGMRGEGSPRSVATSSSLAWGSAAR